VVGVVIFIIITIVQFMVITKGSERIAEVGARFALDAMPGKQMTIDADFNQGLISAEEAIKRREDLQRESALFGSMDGAMKFVKGDAIAGILITVINAIGGLAIGMGIVGLPMDEALNKYTILTIGDGLCAQLPALMMSVACGIMMSRSTASSSSLGKDLVSQLQNKPYSLIFAAVFLVIIGVATVPLGMPWYVPIVFVTFAIFVGILALNVFLQSDVQQQMGQLEQVKQDMNNMVNPNRMYERLGVDILSVQVGNDLLRIADPEQDGQLLGKIAALRSRLTDELGYILPNVRIMDSPTVLPQQYLISIRNNPVATGSVYPDYYMLLASHFTNAGLDIPDNVIRDKDPSYEMEAIWMLPDDIPQELQRHMVEATDAVINHLQEISVKYVDEILSKMDVLKLMEMVRQQDQSLIQELVPNI
jgi:flagellar biosynthesis protein FlhA